MKRILVAGALILSLAACGRNNAGGGGGTVTPAVPDAYNPDASTTVSTDTRVPYVGDWVWVAKLPDNTYRRGTLSINAKGDNTSNAVNGGRGSSAVCTDATCANTTEPSYSIILSAVSGSEAKLVGFVGNAARNGNRLAVTDADGKVTLNTQGRPVLSGSGSWFEAAGQAEQTAKIAFVQIDATGDGQYGSVSLTDVVSQAQTAADAVTVQQMQSLPKIDVKSILK